MSERAAPVGAKADGMQTSADEIAAQMVERQMYVVGSEGDYSGSSEQAV